MSPSPRVALVLGAGGSVGHAFHLGVLSAFWDELGWDAREADVIIGTSAGSVVGAGLRAGLSAADMRNRALGRRLSAVGRKIVERGEAAIATAADPAEESPVTNPGDDLGTRLRRYRMASPERMLRAIREPWRVTPGSLFSAMIPPGRLSTEHLGAPYDAMFGDAWPLPRLWITAVELDVGRRVVFGRDAELTASVGQAVQASCAVPGYFAPVTIGDGRYVDGGAHSTTNADLAAERGGPEGGAGEGPDLVIVSAPMSPERVGTDLSPRSALRQIARRWLASEVAGLRDRGLDVVTFQPSNDDLAAMAGNSMDPGKAPAVVARVHDSTVARLRQPDLADRLVPLAG